MQITENAVVSMHYTLTDEQGQELDSSVGQEPLVFLSGAQNIIDGLDKALQGKAAGDKLAVSVAPEDGYLVLFVRPLRLAASAGNDYFYADEVPFIKFKK